MEQFLSTVRRKVLVAPYSGQHDLMVFAVKKEKSVRHSQDDISIWSELFEDFNNP